MDCATHILRTQKHFRSLGIISTCMFVMKWFFLDDAYIQLPLHMYIQCTETAYPIACMYTETAYPIACMCTLFTETAHPIACICTLFTETASPIACIYRNSISYMCTYITCQNVYSTTCVYDVGAGSYTQPLSHNIGKSHRV